MSPGHFWARGGFLQYPLAALVDLSAGLARPPESFREALERNRFSGSSSAPRDSTAPNPRILSEQAFLAGRDQRPVAL